MPLRPHFLRSLPAMSAPHSTPPSSFLNYQQQQKQRSHISVDIFEGQQILPQGQQDMPLQTCCPKHATPNMPPQTCHPKHATLANYYFALKAIEKRRSRYKQSSLTSLICLKIGHKLVRMFPVPSLPERTAVNPRRQMYTLLSPQMAPEKPM